MILLSFRHLSSEKDDLTIKPKQVWKAFLNWGCQESSTTCCEKKLLMWICIMCFAFNLRIIPESRSVLRNKVQKVQLSCGSFILLKERTENKHHILSVPCLWRVQNCRCATLGLHTHSVTLSPITHSLTLRNLQSIKLSWWQMPYVSDYDYISTLYTQWILNYTRLDM